MLYGQVGGSQHSGEIVVKRPATLTIGVEEQVQAYVEFYPLGRYLINQSIRRIDRGETSEGCVTPWPPVTSH